jgi:hypothetical protein
MIGKNSDWERSAMAKTPLDISEEISSDPNIVSFVVRVWREDRSNEEEDIWRGHMTPIPDGTRHYFRSIEEIPEFMLDYLKSIK